MTTFEQWNYGDGQRGVLPSTKKGVISYEKSARSSLNYAFVNHPHARLLCNYLLTKTIDLFREMATVAEYLHHRLCLKPFGSQIPNKRGKGYVLEYCDNSPSVPI